MGVIKDLFKKWTCCHDWKIMRIVKYPDCDTVLLSCTKCGKLKKKTI